jgi:enoyl-[acyl-carrier-protein] reductase (NADH)
MPAPWLCAALLLVGASPCVAGSKQYDAGSKRFGYCDVTDEASVGAVFDQIAKTWGRLDFVVHAIAFSDKEELKVLCISADNI